MTWASYIAFLGLAVVLVLIPGPDFLVVTRNALVGGRRRGLSAALGVACSNTLQGLAAAAGLGAVIVRAQPLFDAIKWVGVGYLAFLGVRALRSAITNRYEKQGGAHTRGEAVGSVFPGWRQGFLSNITNPKVLLFYLAVLPQFLSPAAPVIFLAVFALSHAFLSLSYLSLLVVGMDRGRTFLTRRRTRRTIDTATGTLLLGFSVRLATDHT